MQPPFELEWSIGLPPLPTHNIANNRQLKYTTDDKPTTKVSYRRQATYDWGTVPPTAA